MDDLCAHSDQDIVTNRQIIIDHESEQEGKSKKPWYIRLKGGSPMVFVGLWDSWKSPEGEVVEACILTMASNRLIGPLTAILPPDGYRVWGTAGIRRILPVWRISAAGRSNGDVRVSPQVNSVSNDAADLLDPVQPDTKKLQGGLL